MKPGRFWRFCVEARLFCARQDRMLNGEIAKRWEMAQGAGLATISCWLEVVGIFFDRVLISSKSIQNLFSQSLCLIPRQGVFLFALQNGRCPAHGMRK